MTTYNFTGRSLVFYDREDTYVDDHKIYLSSTRAVPILTLVPNGEALNVYSNFKTIRVNGIEIPLQVYSDCDEFPQTIEYDLFKDEFIVPSLWAQVARQLGIIPPQTKLYTVCNIVYYRGTGQSVGIQGLEVK